MPDTHSLDYQAIIKLADNAEITLRDDEAVTLTRSAELSPFVKRVLEQFPKDFFKVYESKAHWQKPDRASAYFDNLNRSLLNVESEAELMQDLRVSRQSIMAVIAHLDLSKSWSITQSMKIVSMLADCLINAANQWWYEKLSERFGYPQDKQELHILAMGKLGGHELNFSSDIDLIFCYPSSGETSGGRKDVEHHVFFTKLAQKLIHALNAQTLHGQVYRVDMRLRPHGDSGSLVLPFSALEVYYQEQGREWERFAMQKARLLKTTNDSQWLLSIIKPFVYKRYLDFTTIESIREMKRLISQEVKRRNLIGNIKLGKGGIREVEFFVQSLQLIHAGRLEDCQSTSLLASLSALNTHEFISDDDYKTLQSEYLFLRTLEQYLQIYNDEQTQTLPSQDDTKRRDYLTTLFADDKLFNVAGGLPTSEDGSLYHQLSIAIETSMARIHRIFKSLISDTDEKESPENDFNKDEHEFELGEALWSFDVSYSELHDQFELQLKPRFHEMLDTEYSNPSFDNPKSHDSDEDSNSVQPHQAKPEPATEHVDEFIEIFLRELNSFKSKASKQSVSEKSRKALTRLMPVFIEELISLNIKSRSTIDSVGLKNRVVGAFSVLATILGRVTYIDLLTENQAVRRRLIDLCEKSLWVAKQISIYPILLDELLHPVYLTPQKQSFDEYANELRDDLRQQMLRVEPDDIELVMDTLRQFKHAHQLRVAAADIANTLPTNEVSDRLTALGEVLISEVTYQAWQQIGKRHGTPNDGNNLIIVGYGKFGGLELSYGSDLDLVFLYQTDRDSLTDDTGEKDSISHHEFYTKLVQRIRHLCSTQTYQGQMYEIDMRLRPSGNSGLLVSSIFAFGQYQNQEAWTWEHQALVRARCIFGKPELVNEFNTLRASILCQYREQTKLKQDIDDMRIKMREHLDKSNLNGIDIKQAAGGIVDIEFFVQYLTLLNSHLHPKLCFYSDNLRILESAESLALITADQRENLCNAYLWLRHLGHQMQLSQRKLAYIDESLIQNLQQNTKLIEQMRLKLESL